MSRTKYNTVSFAFIIFSLLSVVGAFVPSADSDVALSIANKLFFDSALTSVLICTGYFIKTNEAIETKQKLKKNLMPLLLSYGFAAGLSFFIFFFIQVSGKSIDINAIFNKFAFLLTKGFPEQLFIIPALIIALPLLFFALKKLSLKTVTVISAVLYVISALLINLSPLFPENFSGIHKFFVSVFGGNHAGIFSVLLFVVLGISLGKKERYRKKYVYIISLAASTALFIAEAYLMISFKGNTDSYFYISAAPLAWSLFAVLFNLPEIKFADKELLTLFGKSFFISGHIAAAAGLFSRNYPDAVFTNFFADQTVSTETVLIISVICSLFFCAYKSDSEDIISVFINLVQKLILTILYIPTLLFSKINIKIKNALCITAFAALPVLLWFIERTIEYSLCCDIFAACLVVILLCSTEKKTAPGVVFKKGFIAFFVIGLVLFLSSSFYCVPEFADIGRMMMFFFFPLGITLAGNKDSIDRLIKNYTYGLYISYGIFFYYCACFRPYDITRYKGAFCNANMCGLYLITVCLAALCSLPKIKSIKDIIKQPLHWFVFGTSFAFIAFTISRTCAAGIIMTLAVKFCAEFFAENSLKSINGKAVKNAAVSALVLLMVMASGLVISYTAIRCIPALIDNPIFILNEYVKSYEYKVKPGESFFSENYISPLRFFEAWFNRSFASYDNVNELSTGRIDIYLQYLKSISLYGHSAVRIPIYTTGEIMYAHNAFLQIAFNCGILEGIGWLGLCIAVILRGIKNSLKDKKHAIFAAVAVSAYFTCGMFESIETFYYPLLFSALFGFMLFMITPSEKDVIVDFNITERKEITEKEAAEVKAKDKISSLTVKRILLTAIVAVLFAVFIYLLIISRDSQAGMNLFYQFMG